MPLLLSLSALALCLAAAVLVYLASSHQQLIMRRLPPVARAGAVLCGLAGTALWCATISWGAGIAAALTALMLTWVVLPYMAWRLRSTNRGEKR